MSVQETKPGRTETTLSHQLLIEPIDTRFAGTIWPDISAVSIDTANILLASARDAFRSEFSKLPVVAIHQEMKRRREGIKHIADPYARAAYLCGGRLNHIGLDCDGTINSGFTYNHLVPGSQELEASIKGIKDVRKWIAAFAQYVLPHLKTSEQTFYDIGKNVELRPGIAELFDFCARHGIEVEIFSRQFKPIVLGQLDNLPVHIRKTIPDERVHAITATDIRPVYKGPMLALSAAKNGGTITGAGDSDIDLSMFGATAATMVAFFVPEGSILDYKIKNGKVTALNGTPVLRFEDGFEIRDDIKAIGRCGEELGLVI